MKTLIALLITTTAATAQQNCATREKALASLQGKYSETVRVMGMGPNNSILEMHASDKTGSWTITVTHPNGITCMLASGKHFEAIPKGDEL